MSFDGILLEKLHKELDFLITARISKINEAFDTDFIFQLRRDKKNYSLMLSFSSTYSRIHLTKHIETIKDNPKGFTLFLRKHIEGYFIKDIKTYNSDRIIYFVLEGYNALQDLETKYLICEVMGRYSNLILTDDNFIILDALKHDGIGEYNRTILPNAKYEFPQTNKLNPFDFTYDELESIFKEKKITDVKGLMSTFNGVSLSLAYPVFLNDRYAKNFYDFIHLDIKPVIYTNFNQKLDFYFYPLEGNVLKEFSTISDLLDDFYYEEELKLKIKIKTNDLNKFILKQIDKYEKKLLKLNKDLEETKDSYIYMNYGNLLLGYTNLKEKAKELTLKDYITNEDVKIPLDNKYTVLDNANRYFKKYQKLKTSTTYIKEQEEIAKSEIEYFTLLKYQLQQASLSEALEIKQELINNKYLFEDSEKPNKRKDHPKLLTYILPSKALVYVGKNNIQNDYLTNKLAKPNDLWFHIKDAPGSHVILETDNVIDEDIRYAAIIASYYSTFRDSSSVAVDYTKQKNIKKIPGKKGCFVTYKNQSTIYIDPDINIINKLEVKKWTHIKDFLITMMR